MSTNLRKLPGLLLCLLLALPAWYLGRLFPIIGAPVLLFFQECCQPCFMNIVTRLKRELVLHPSIFCKQQWFCLVWIKPNPSYGSRHAVFTHYHFNYCDSSFGSLWLTEMAGLRCQYSHLGGCRVFHLWGSAIAATAPVIKAKDDEVAKAISVIFSLICQQLCYFQVQDNYWAYLMKVLLFCWDSC